MHPSALALGRLPVGQMNDSEAAYAHHLDLRQRAGDVALFRFEPMALRLAKKTYYKPDFLVMLGDRTLELHEVKGFWTDDARVKIKVAASLFTMFRFVAVRAKLKRDGGGWAVEEF